MLKSIYFMWKGRLYNLFSQFIVLTLCRIFGFEKFITIFIFM